LTIDEPFIVFGPANDAIWTGTIKGGTLPYKVHITWGDGAANDYKLTTSGKQHFVHHYRSMYPHVITLRVDDSAGRAAQQNYAAVTPSLPPPFVALPTKPWTGSLILTLYGTYLLLLVVFGGTWTQAHPFEYAKVPVRNTHRAVAKRKSKTTRR